MPKTEPEGEELRKTNYIVCCVLLITLRFVFECHTLACHACKRVLLLYNQIIYMYTCIYV